MNKFICRVAVGASSCATAVGKTIKPLVSKPRLTMLFALLFVFTIGIMAQNTAGNYEAGTTALGTVTEEINFMVNPTKYNTYIKSYLPNNKTSYSMNYKRKENFNNT